MRNYICINGAKKELTEEQINKIIAENQSATGNIKLADIEEGSTFNIGMHEFIVLEQSGNTTAIISKNLLTDSRFGNNNNYSGSSVDAVCCEFAEEISSIVEKENIVPHTVDLTSNDGLKDYGTINRLVSVLTADRYRRYVEILDKFKIDDWWWLSTPFSTKKHRDDIWVLCVSPSGYINDFNYRGNGNGVRPFCILKSDIFVSK